MDELTATLQQALTPGYTIERELTGGGMSRVFVARDIALGRQVVVKVLPPELAAGVNHERFRREIQVAAALQHPHIVPLLSAGEQGALIWYTMPYIEGHSVREALARGERYAIRDVVRILRNVADALDYAHSRGVIHRDIKPGNVLLLGAHALVTDFGVSKAISAALPTSGSTSAGVALGTPAYMAPEQLAADPAADHRLDLYALGLLGYELLTGKVPFKEDSPQKTMAAQLTRDPAPIEASRSDCPPALIALLKKLLAKIPDDRPQRASDVVALLDEIAVSSGSHLAPLLAARRPSALRISMIAAAGVLVVASAWVLGQHRGGEVVSQFVRDSIARAESLQVSAPAAAILTREDSMAIAKAVSSRLAARGQPTAPAPSASASRGSDSLRMVAFADSIRVQVQRVALESLFRLEAERMRALAQAGAAGAVDVRIPQTTLGDAPGNAPNLREQRDPSREQTRITSTRRAGPRRIAIALPRPNPKRPELEAIAQALGDSLRARLGKDVRYRVIDADSVAAVLRASRTVNAVREKLDADVIVSISLAPTRDSVTRIVLLRVGDLSAPQGFTTRLLSSSGSIGEPADGITELMPNVVRSLEEMERGSGRNAWPFTGFPAGEPRRGAAPVPPKVPDPTATAEPRPRP